MACGEGLVWGAIGRLVNVEGRFVLRVGLGKIRPRWWASGRGGSRGCAGCSRDGARVKGRVQAASVAALSLTRCLMPCGFQNMTVHCQATPRHGSGWTSDANHHNPGSAAAWAQHFRKHGCSTQLGEARLSTGERCCSRHCLALPLLCIVPAQQCNQGLSEWHPCLADNRKPSDLG